MKRAKIEAVLKPDVLAYWDTFAGLVPCKVRHVRKRNNFGWEVDITLTADRAPYKNGEIHDNQFASRVVPRQCVRRLRSRTGQPYIIPYKVSES